jgi:hypothetical protein
MGMFSHGSGFNKGYTFSEGEKSAAISNRASMANRTLLLLLAGIGIYRY